jgi:hypothetical protein
MARIKLRIALDEEQSFDSMGKYYGGKKSSISGDGVFLSVYVTSLS